MNYQLTEEQNMLVDSLRAFLEEEIYPHEAEADRKGEVPEELGNKIKARAIEMGFFLICLWLILREWWAKPLRLLLILPEYCYS